MRMPGRNDVGSMKAHDRLDLADVPPPDQVPPVPPPPTTLRAPGPKSLLSRSLLAGRHGTSGPSPHRHDVTADDTLDLRRDHGDARLQRTNSSGWPQQSRHQGDRP